MTNRRSWKVLGSLIRWNAHRTMSHYYFFLTVVQPQPPGERALTRFWRRWLHLVSSPSSPIRRWLNYGTKGSRGCSTLLKKRRILSAPCLRRRHMHISFTRQWENSGHYLSGPAGGAWWPGWRRFQLPRRGWWQGGHGCLLNLFFAFSSLLSPPGILFLFIRYNGLFVGKTNTLFLFWRGLILITKIRFNYNNFFGSVSLSGDMSCVEVDRSHITIFCCSIRPTFSVMCGLSCFLFMVVGCSCFCVAFIFYNRHSYFYLFTLFLKGFFT